MHHLTARLMLWSDLPRDSILQQLSGIWADWEADRDTAAGLTRRVYREVKRLLDLATTYGFDGNLWQNYLTFVMVTHLNSFSLTCEQRGASDGSINRLATEDFGTFRQLFDFDFAPLEAALGKANDPEYLQELAREQLNMVSPGQRDFYDVSN